MVNIVKSKILKIEVFKLGWQAKDCLKGEDKRSSEEHIGERQICCAFAFLNKYLIHFTISMLSNIINPVSFSVAL